MDRMRRLRQNEAIRSMVRENHIRTDELIYPLFVIEGENLCNPIPSMPGSCYAGRDKECAFIRCAGT